MFSVLLCMPQKLEHLKSPKFPGGSVLPGPPGVQPCSLLQLMTLSPQVEKVMYDPELKDVSVL